MLAWLFKRVRRQACEQLMTELFRYNKRDYCWDPIGSIDHNGVLRMIDSIASGTLHPTSVRLAKDAFKKKAMILNPKFDPSLLPSRKGIL